MVIITNILKEKIFNGDIDLDEDTFNVVLCYGLGDLETSAVREWNSYSDVSPYEVTGNGYTAGGKELSNVNTTSAVGDATKQKWFCDDVTWESISATTDSVAIYDTTVTNTLVSVFTLSTEVSAVGGDFTLNWNEQGILTLES